MKTISLQTIDLKTTLVDLENKNLKSKLLLIDSQLPDILAQALIISHKNALTNLLEVANELVITNPLNYDQSLGHRFYHYKLKMFVIDTVLALRPSFWSNLFISDKKEDQISISEDVLKRAKFNIANTPQNGLGKIYKYNGELFLKLLLQIIFYD